jgi:hypothetical protein
VGRNETRIEEPAWLWGPKYSQARGEVCRHASRLCSRVYGQYNSLDGSAACLTAPNNNAGQGRFTASSTLSALSHSSRSGLLCRHTPAYPAEGEQGYGDPAIDAEQHIEVNRHHPRSRTLIITSRPHVSRFDHRKHPFTSLQAP